VASTYIFSKTGYVTLFIALRQKCQRYLRPIRYVYVYKIYEIYLFQATFPRQQQF